MKVSLLIAESDELVSETLRQQLVGKPTTESFIERIKQALGEG
jgi:hypothetical protein